MALHCGLVFGLQELARRRSDGGSTWVALERKPPVEQVADGVFAVATALTLGGPAAVLAGLRDAPPSPAPAAAIGLLAVSTAVARSAQRTMGASWRTGVGDEPSDELVTGGVFRWIRNPVYTTLVSAATGAALLSPTRASFAGAAAFGAGLQWQTRLVEEPHLLEAHGDAYARYAASAGRFLPGIGRIGPATASARRPRTG